MSVGIRIGDHLSKDRILRGVSRMSGYKYEDSNKFLTDRSRGHREEINEVYAKAEAYDEIGGIVLEYWEQLKLRGADDIHPGFLIKDILDAIVETEESEEESQ